MKRLLALFALTMAATATAAEPDVVLEKVVLDISVNADGTYTTEAEIVSRIVTERGARGVGQMPLSFSESLQTLDILEAYVLAPDGKRKDVDPTQIITQGLPTSLAAPVFTDNKVRVVVFPAPQAGGKVAVRTRTQQKKPLITGHFSYFHTASNTSAQDSVTVRLSAPLDFPLRTHSPGMEGGRLPDKDGRARWEWRFSNPRPRTAEPFEVDEERGYLAVSSFADWGQLARAYSDGASGKVIVTPEIERLASDITKGMSEPAAKAAAIHHWVARNVRYVALALGMGGIVPRESGAILETRYGDCKDKTVLAQSMLNAIGIKSEPVLVSTHSRYTLPEVPVLAAFNHAILYLPDLGKYVDGTSSSNRFGSLPTLLYGKPVLNTVTGRVQAIEGPTLVEQKVVNRVKLTVDVNGSVKGSSEIEAHGTLEASLRERFRAFKESEAARFVAAWLSETGQTGEGSVEKPDPLDLGTPFVVKSRFEMPRALNLDSPGAFRIPRGFAFSTVANGVNDRGFAGPRKTAFQCGPVNRFESYEVEIPTGLKVTALPKDVRYKDSNSAFEATYRQQENRIFVERTLVRDRIGGVCPPAQWADTQAIKAAIDRDARSQVVLQ